MAINLHILSNSPEIELYTANKNGEYHCFFLPLPCQAPLIFIGKLLLTSSCLNVSQKQTNKQNSFPPSMHHYQLERHLMCHLLRLYNLSLPISS